MKFGIGNWSKIVDSQCLVGKTVAQMNLQTQRMLGQQSTAGKLIDRLKSDHSRIRFSPCRSFSNWEDQLPKTGATHQTQKQFHRKHRRYFLLQKVIKPYSRKNIEGGEKQEDPGKQKAVRVFNLLD